MLSGSVVTFPGSGGDFNSGFIAQIIGTFSPGTPLQFTDSTTAEFNPDAFTIGVSFVPEPSTFGMAIIGAIGVISLPPTTAEGWNLKCVPVQTLSVQASIA